MDFLFGAMCNMYGGAYRSSERYRTGWLDPREVMRDGLLEEGLWLYTGIFPRNDDQKVRRMNKMMQWKRNQIATRWKRRVVVGAILLFGTPAVIAATSALWRVALASVLS